MQPQITNSRYEKQAITPKHTGIKRIVSEYYKLYAHVFDNLDETDQFLEKTRGNR